jgi:DegV family protein with EDD domain
MKMTNGSGMLIVTDGAVDLPEDLEQSPLLRTVPGEIWLGEVPLTGSPDEFWALLRRGIYPSTSPPTVGALADAYRHQGPVVAIHVSARLSATMARAGEAAARSAPAAVLVDSRSLSVGAGLVAAVVHRAIQGRSDPRPIIDLARSLPERLHTFAVIQEVESLRQSDRSGLLPAAHLRRNHPLLLAIRGRVVPLSQPRNRSRALEDLASHLGHRPGPWALGHGDASDRDAVVDRLTRVIGRPPAFLARLDPTVGAHAGPESIVVGIITGPVEL